MPQVNYVDSTVELARLVSHLQPYKTIAIDTEFIRERTYYPELCLIQLATVDDVWCIDPLTIDRLDALFEIFGDNNVTKVFHAARQDLEILYNLLGTVPSPVFDTQIAAAFLGHPDQLSYANLVKAYTSIDLDKSLSRTNWAQRPLSDEQIHYAADDVRYLLDIREQLIDEMQAHGRVAWMTEECRHLVAIEHYANEPKDAWRRVKGINKLDEMPFGVAVALAEWRERRAQDRNLPRNWVLKDDRLLELAKQQPDNRKKLHEIDGIAPGLLRSAADEIVDTIRTARNASPMASERSRVDPSQSNRAFVKEVIAKLQQKATDLGIPPSLITSRREIEAAVAGSDKVLVFQGWRESVFGNQLKEMINTHAMAARND